MMLICTKQQLSNIWSSITCTNGNAIKAMFDFNTVGSFSDSVNFFRNQNR